MQYLKTELLKSVQISIFCNNFFDIAIRHFKFHMLILNIIMEGTVSQIFIVGPSSYFMLFRK